MLNVKRSMIIMKIAVSLLLLALLVPGSAESHDDEDWHCIWVDNHKQPWGWHAGVDSFKYNAIDYDAAVLGGALGGVVGASVGNDRLLGGVIGAAAGAILGYQYDRNKQKPESYMKCTPKGSK